MACRILMLTWSCVLLVRAILNCIDVPFQDLMSKGTADQFRAHQRGFATKTASKAKAPWILRNYTTDPLTFRKLLEDRSNSLAGPTSRLSGRHSQSVFERFRRRRCNAGGDCTSKIGRFVNRGLGRSTEKGGLGTPVAGLKGTSQSLHQKRFGRGGSLRLQEST